MASTLTIAKGDTLSGLAGKYGTTVNDLLKANPNITNPNLIQAGASLNLPTAPVTPATPAAAPVVPPAPTKPPTEPTVLSSDKSTQIANANQTLQQRTSQGAVTGSDGVTRDALGAPINKPTSSGPYKMDSKGNIVTNDYNQSIVASKDENGAYSNVKNAQGQTLNGLDSSGNLLFGDNTTTSGKVGSGDPSSPDYDPSLDPIYLQNIKLIDDMREQFDASSLAQINAIKATYDGLIEQQKQNNASAEAARNTSLLLSGSSRYAQLSSTGIMHSQVSYGLSQISDLQAQENNAIAGAMAAQASGDMQLMSKRVDLATEIMKQKQDAMQKQADLLREEKQKQDAAKLKSDQDMAIATIMQNGITDPAGVLKTLRKNGYNTTLADINDTIKNLTPDAKSITDMVQAAVDNGAPQDVIQSIGKAKSLNDAYAAAGQWASKATGTVGEYNIAKAGGYKGALADYQSAVEYKKALATAKAGADTAYANAYNSAAGKAAADAANASPADAAYAGLNELQKEKAKQDVLDYQTAQGAYENDVLAVLQAHGFAPGHLTEQQAEQLTDDEVITLSKGLNRINSPDIARAPGGYSSDGAIASEFGSTGGIELAKLQWQREKYGRNFLPSKVAETVNHLPAKVASRHATVAPYLDTTTDTTSTGQVKTPQQVSDEADQKIATFGKQSIENNKAVTNLMTKIPGKGSTWYAQQLHLLP